ncbi:hypothetical protein N7468_009270 [Penicillium chermesinum]|uniref:NADH:ubiquinone oxidoreductase intermediate-associated protein 30 domain-containing protein n=1 Tax=Penicillium chermesinum TaxID=63820 RepID=A0A9W9NHH2_9EURO|nr:uncharacterized protein N7468_009270 [Penicillium chermesinum]KAJ5220066.1 hypothetical protein N7468_009270 [Penicillium chermesinum]KAJ6157516.1 hypothetical protein N7470_005108 [Penicillium chermesinum]
MTETSHLPLFGGSRAWTPDEWTSSDDRVRGGSSKSTLEATAESLVATFKGTLDITTLGGAGFASQRTATEDGRWDLSEYDGIELKIDHADGKLYTLTLKDEILAKRPDGREQSTLSWEFDFRPHGATTYFIKWADFRPTYRGRDQEGVEPLDLKNVRRFGIMIRSFFGGQEGPFELGITSIAALRTERYLDHPEEEPDEYFDEKLGAFVQRRPTWFGWFTSCLGCR